jgi:hypothetical protein
MKIIGQLALCQLYHIDPENAIGQNTEHLFGDSRHSGSYRVLPSGLQPQI